MKSSYKRIIKMNMTEKFAQMRIGDSCLLCGKLGIPEPYSRHNMQRITGSVSHYKKKHLQYHFKIARKKTVDGFILITRIG